MIGAIAMETDVVMPFWLFSLNEGSRFFQTFGMLNDL